MTSNTYFSENWNASWNHPRLLKRSSSAITQKQFQTCLSHIQLKLKKKKKKGEGRSWFIQQAFFLLRGATAAPSAAHHVDNKHQFLSNSVLLVAAFTWKTKQGLLPEPL